MKHSIKISVAVLLLNGGALQTLAQLGYSSASYSLMKQRSGRHMLPSPDEVIVEELINYHHHNIPLPAADRSVGIDLRWGHGGVGEDMSEAVLQIGLATGHIKSYEDTRPLNVALVIDKSGSMGGDRIEKARQASETFVQHLREIDMLSIVTFDHHTSVLLSPQYVLNKKNTGSIIRAIEAGGSTDLNSGLIKGYEQVAANYDEKKTNKIILLTDGLSNTGELDLEKIVQNAARYSKGHQISITVIAIGDNFNNLLTRQITESGKHSIHFLHDEDDLNKVFVREVEALLSPVATDVKMRISMDEGLDIVNFPGYSPIVKGNDIYLDLNNMNAGLTQVVLCKVAPRNRNRPHAVKVTLTYWDIRKQKTVTEDASINLYRPGRNVMTLADEDVRKNYMIATMAQALKQMAVFAGRNEMMRAENAIRSSLNDVDRVYHGHEDQDVKHVKAMLERYMPLCSMAIR